MKNPVVYLNPGHGGKDPGACANGLREKEINLEVALKLNEILKSLGYTVYLSRTTDVQVVLDTVNADIRAKKPDLVISVHHNAGNGDGCELFYQMNNPESKKVAALIEAEYQKIGQNSRGIKVKKGIAGDYYAILREPFKSGVTAVLSEFAFLDHAADYKCIDEKAERIREAEAIARGVQAYFGYQRPQEPENPCDTCPYRGKKL